MIVEMCESPMQKTKTIRKRRKSVTMFEIERISSTTASLNVDRTYIRSIERTLFISIFCLFISSLVLLGPSLFGSDLVWVDSLNKTNVTTDVWGVTTERNLAEPEGEPEAEPKAEPEAEAKPETEPEPEAKVEPEPEPRPMFDRNVYIRGPHQGIASIGTKFSLFDYQSITLPLILRCIYPTVLAFILGLTGLALERTKGKASGHIQEQYDDIAFRISRRRLFKFAYQKEKINNNPLAFTKTAEDDNQWLNVLMSQEIQRFRRIVARRRFSFYNVFCLHSVGANTFFYALLTTLVAVVAGLAYLVRTASFVRRNVILYCALLPVIERSLLPLVAKITVRFYFSSAKNKWFSSSTSEFQGSAEFMTFMTNFRALIINCFLFPLIISWDPLSAWNLSMASSTQDSQVATAALKRYSQLWIFGSSEITIYIWSTATITQIFLIGPALYKYCSKSKQEQQPTTNTSDQKIVLFAVPATFYGIFLASFVALVSSNPFVFVIAAIVLFVNKLMFFIRCKLSATRSKYELEQTQIKNVAMFTQNAWITFTSFFVPGLFLTTWFFLLPFNPIGISIVAVLNIASTAVIFVALRKKYPSPLHFSRIDIRKKMKVIKKK